MTARGSPLRQFDRARLTGPKPATKGLAVRGSDRRRTPVRGYRRGTALGRVPRRGVRRRSRYEGDNGGGDGGYPLGNGRFVGSNRSVSASLTFFDESGPTVEKRTADGTCRVAARSGSMPPGRRIRRLLSAPRSPSSLPERTRRYEVTRVSFRDWRSASCVTSVPSSRSKRYVRSTSIPTVSPSLTGLSSISTTLRSSPTSLST